jgi:hypothetical protein
MEFPMIPKTDTLINKNGHYVIGQGEHYVTLTKSMAVAIAKEMISLAKSGDIYELNGELYEKAVQSPKETHQIVAERTQKPEGVSDVVWDNFLSHRRKKKANASSMVLDAIEQEARKAGWTLEEALKEMIVRGWHGFKHTWVENKTVVPDRDPTLIKLEDDFKKATPMPANIREMMQGVVKRI